MRKIVGFLLAIMILLNLSTMAFAENDDGSAEPTTYSITIMNSDTGHTYEAYQILIGDVYLETVGQITKKRLTEIQWGANATKTGAASNTDLQLIKNHQYANFVDFDSDPVASTSTCTGGMYVIDGLATGYYLVQDKKDTLGGIHDAHTAFILEVVESSEVSPKSAKPTLDKQVWDEAADAEEGHTGGWGETADHAINETFQFKLIANLPADEDFEFYSSYLITFTDTMSTGITFESIDSVKVGATVLAEGEYTCSAQNGQAGGSWTLAIADLTDISGVNLVNGTTVEVIYSAHLNENAKPDVAENKNSVYLEYSNNPNVGGEDDLGRTVEDHVWVFTYKVDNTKTDDANAPLPNAGFRLYSDDECTNEFALIFDTTLSAYRPVKAGEAGVEMISGPDGKFNIVGLDDGTYYLHETTIPRGYNPCDDITIVISATHKEAATRNSAELTFSTTTNKTNVVINQSGIELPETGGTGTTILYITGAIMVLAAFVLLVTKKRMSSM